MSVSRGDAPGCPFAECGGSGWILGPDDEARPCRCLERRVSRAKAHGVSSVIPPKYRGVGFERPPVTQMDARVVRAVRRFVTELPDQIERGGGLWLYGPNGTGKTTLAMIISKAALDAGRTVAIYSAPKLLARIRATFDAPTGEASYLEFFERLTSVDLLHIDDLGAERSSEWVLEQLYSLINQRYEEQRSVIVTSNLEQAELAEQVGARTVSRLIEICGENVLPLFGDDQRAVYRVAS